MFLATTALEEFWDPDDRIVFLGEWCKLYSRKDFWGKLDCAGIPEISEMWRDGRKISESIQECDSIYESALAALTESLNGIHGIHEDRQYYRIILGNWLLTFINVAYERYYSLDFALKRHGGINTRLLDGSQYIVPADYNDFISAVSQDFYNLQLYSQTLDAMGMVFERKKAATPMTQTARLESGGRDLKSGLVNLAMKAASLKSFFSKETITLTEPYFKYSPASSYYGLVSRSNGNLVFDNMNYPYSFGFSVDSLLREKLEAGGAETGFGKVLSRLIKCNMPAIFLECFGRFRDFVNGLPIARSKVFATLNSMHHNNVYKFFMAENHGKVKSLIIQHGGCYGTENKMVIEDYEKSVCDRFYTWGWSDGDKTVPLNTGEVGSLKIAGESRRAAADRNVCLIMTLQPRYHYRFRFEATNYNFSRIMDGDISFLSRLDSTKIKKVVRFYMNDKTGWDVKVRFEESGVEYVEDVSKKKFSELIDDIYICVFDHLGTAYLESLALNRPTVVFIDRKYFKFRDSAQPFFDTLEKVKILHYSPESASDHVGRIYGDADKWWRCRGVQDARRAFVERYARTTKNWAGEWIREFEKVLYE